MVANKVKNQITESTLMIPLPSVEIRPDLAIRVAIPSVFVLEKFSSFPL